MAGTATLPAPAPDARYELPPVTVLDVRGADQLWQERPILEHLHTYARARRVSPWAVLGYALAQAVTATPPSVALPPIIGGYASLNLFVGIVGPSGAGKGAAFAVAREALNVGDITTLNPGSGEGIIHAYVKRTQGALDQHTTAVLFNVPEIDTLAAVGSRQGSTVMPILRSGWSGEQIGTQTADISRRVHVADHAYRMCMVAGIQPGRAGSLLDDADGGTPQRFLWLPATDPGMPDVAPDAPTPQRLKNLGQIVVNGFVDGRGLVAMTVCQTAKDTITEAHLARVRGDGEALDGHALLTRLKVAAALAILEGRQDVTDEDWRISRTITRVSDATRASVVAHRSAALAKSNEARAKGEAERQIIVSETVAEKAVAKVARSVLRHLDGGEGTWAPLRKLLRSTDRPYFEEAVDHLVKSGQISVENITGSGTEGRVLRAI